MAGQTSAIFSFQVGIKQAYEGVRRRKQVLAVEVHHSHSLAEEGAGKVERDPKEPCFMRVENSLAGIRRCTPEVEERIDNRSLVEVAKPEAGIGGSPEGWV